MEKNSETKNAKMYGKYSGFSAPSTSMWKATGAGLSGAPKKWPGSSVTPNGMPATVTAAMVIRNAPGTLRADRAVSRTSPARASSAAGRERSPSASALLAGFATTRPLSLKPRRAMKRPRPPLMAYLRFCGISRVIRSRMPSTVSTRKATPDHRTMPSAASQGTWSCPTMVTASRATPPRPGARTNGRFANRPMARVASTIAMITAVVTGPCGTPALASWPGTTTTA